MNRASESRSTTVRPSWSGESSKMRARQWGGVLCQDALKRTLKPFGAAVGRDPDFAKNHLDPPIAMCSFWDLSIALMRG